ncbi:MULTISPECIES: DUF4307 domain-containing protein [unclassified Microbacterium]|uniref:DUF4307 domain-containing protein n=1 Tax=unclassified Microbacterium TaxID=2609290 RepID=UPI003017D949
MTTVTPPDDLTDEVRAELDDRYGRRRSGARRRGPWIAFGIVVVAVIGYFGWSTVAQSIETVDVDNTAFHLVDEHSVTVSFQVTLRRGAAVTCAIEAQDTDHGVVGWRVVQYPADDAHTRSFTETIPTVAEATTGLATSCWIP